MYKVIFNFPYASITLDAVDDETLAEYRERMRWDGVFLVIRYIKMGADTVDETEFLVNPRLVTYMEVKKLKTDPWE